MFPRQGSLSRIDQMDSFNDELSLLLQNNVIELSDLQRTKITDYQQTIRGRHKSLSLAQTISFTEKNFSRRMGITCSTTVCTLLAIFALYHYWWGLAPLVQTSILITAPIFLLTTAALLHRHEKPQFLIKIVSLLSFICFISNLLMLCQLYDIDPPEGLLLLWAAFSILLAYKFDQRLLLASSICCVILYSDVVWYGWSSFANRPENYFVIATGLLWLSMNEQLCKEKAFRMVIGFAGVLTVLLAVLLLANAGDRSYILVNENIIEGSYQIIGLCLCAAVIWMSIRKQQVELMNFGIVTFIIFLYAKLYDWWWGHIPNYVFLLVVSISLIFAAVFYRNIRAIFKAHFDVASA